MKTRTNQPVFYDNGQKVDDSALGGTKLYKHSFQIINEDIMTDYGIVIINNSQIPITSLGSVGELIKGLITDANEPDPSPSFFGFIEYKDETEYGSAYIVGNSIIPIEGSSYTTDEVTPL